MSQNVTLYNLLISCPGDIKDEVTIIETAVNEFNELYTEPLGITIKTRHWEKSSYAQSGGKPQSLLNEQFVKKCDAAVAIFWTRFGSPTDEYESGTEEEIEIMLQSSKQVFVYFSNKPISPAEINSDGYQKIQAFREKYKDRGIYFSYSSNEEFKKLFFAHLTQYFISEKKISEVKSERHSKLKVVGIDENQHIIDKASIIKYVPNIEMTFSKYLDKIRNLYSTISDIELEKPIELPESLSNLGISLTQPVTINESDKKIIKSVAKNLNIPITENFFMLGSLSQNPILNVLNGSKEEKQKYNKIQKLLNTISNALKWAPIEQAFADKKCLKLALQNYGTDIDEDIEISLKIPKDSLLPINEFPKFTDNEMEYLLNDCNMVELFCIRSTALYSDYDSSIVSTQKFNPHSPTPSIFSGYTRNYSEDFKNELAEIFSYSCFDEEDEYILKLKIDYIKHNTTVAFPSVIFINKPFEAIPYTITSKNSPDIITGKIEVIDATNNQ